MRKYIVFVFMALVVAAVCFFSSNPCYRPAVKQTGLNVLHHHDDTRRIAYINHKKVKCVIDSIIHDQIRKPVQIRIAGIGGLTSKEIYNGFFSNVEFKSVIEWGPDFCFVSAGINDSNIKNGSDTYKENMRLLISLLIDNHITPVILEIPYYDIYYNLYYDFYYNLYNNLYYDFYYNLYYNLYYDFYYHLYYNLY